MDIDSYPVSIEEPFEFEWQIDTDGYEMLYPEPPPREGEIRHQSTVLTGGVREPCIMRKRGPLRGYRPLRDEPGLFLQFAKTAPTAEAAVEFSNRFGLLGDWKPHDRRPPFQYYLSDWLDARQSTQEMVVAIEAHQLGKKPLSDLVGFYNRYFRPMMQVRLAMPPRRRLQFQVVPTTLLGAICLQLAVHIANGTRFRQCKICPRWFPYGPGTINRKTKVFCSNRCRVAWNRQQKRSASL